MKVIRDASPEAARFFDVLRQAVRDQTRDRLPVRDGRPVALEPGVVVALRDVPAGQVGGWQREAVNELVKRGVLRRTTKTVYTGGLESEAEAVVIVEGFEDAMVCTPVSGRPRRAA